jgi:hypothetical protein
MKPEGKHRYSSTLTLTSALDGSGWSTPRPNRFTSGKEKRYPLYRRLGGPVWTGAENFAPPPSPTGITEYIKYYTKQMKFNLCSELSTELHNAILISFELKWIATYMKWDRCGPLVQGNVQCTIVLMTCSTINLEFEPSTPVTSRLSHADLSVNKFTCCIISQLVYLCSYWLYQGNMSPSDCHVSSTEAKSSRPRIHRWSQGLWKDGRQQRICTDINRVQKCSPQGMKHVSIMTGTMWNTNETAVKINEL